MTVNDLVSWYLQSYSHNLSLFQCYVGSGAEGLRNAVETYRWLWRQKTNGLMQSKKMSMLKEAYNSQLTAKIAFRKNNVGAGNSGNLKKTSIGGKNRNSSGSNELVVSSNNGGSSISDSVGLGESAVVSTSGNIGDAQISMVIENSNTGVDLDNGLIDADSRGNDVMMSSYPVDPLAAVTVTVEDNFSWCIGVGAVGEVEDYGVIPSVEVLENEVKVPIRVKVIVEKEVGDGRNADSNFVWDDLETDDEDSVERKINEVVNSGGINTGDGTKKRKASISLKSSGVSSKSSGSSTVGSAGSGGGKGKKTTVVVPTKGVNKEVTAVKETSNELFNSLVNGDYRKLQGPNSTFLVSLLPQEKNWTKKEVTLEKVRCEM